MENLHPYSSQLYSVTMHDMFAFLKLINLCHEGSTLSFTEHSLQPRHVILFEVFV